MELKTAIAIFCYRRTEQLKITINALLANPESEKMEAIFFCDGYKGDNDKADVLKTRDCVRSIKGFKKIKIQNREKNYKAGPNVFTALIYLCQHYDQFILIEDDVVLSSNGIRFLLDGLCFYRDNLSVFQLRLIVFQSRKSSIFMIAWFINAFPHTDGRAGRTG